MKPIEKILEDILEHSRKLGALNLVLWSIPKDQWPEWLLQGFGSLTHTEYLRRLTLVSQECGLKGINVVMVSPTVAQIVEIMRTENLPDTPDGHASALLRWHTLHPAE